MLDADPAAVRSAGGRHPACGRAALVAAAGRARVQAALSARLVWSNTAFQDEALYLRAGHLEWAHWLHGAPIPDFPAYFSGAPVIYPPLGALADGVGGLAAARLLSLCFMLGVTRCCGPRPARLYGRRAALLAAGLFATLAGTQFLGAFATYDALALFLLALADLAGRAVAAESAPRRPDRVALLDAAGRALVLAGGHATQVRDRALHPGRDRGRQRGGRGGDGAAPALRLVAGR